MPKRVTVLVDDELMKKLRFLQANIMRKENLTCSLSRIINDTIRQGLK